MRHWTSNIQSICAGIPREEMDMEQQTPLLGRAFMEPDAPVTAGTVSTWKFRYQAGPYGIEDSGAIRLAWRMVSD